VSPAEVDCALSLLREESLLIDNGSLLSLTPEGIRTATRVVRAHRLWERHLADETGFPETEWHALADRREHELSPGEVEDLSVRLGRPTLDPHGDPIPGASGEIASPHSVPLSALPAGAGAQIVHLEDEPEERYAELAALGLYPGLFIRMLDGREAGYRFLADGQEHVLSALAAGNISVLPTPPRSPSGGAVDEPLSVLRPGETATVMHISRRCRGAERRRLLDLGLLPGTSVQAEIAAPSGDPTAYRVRGGLIALRQDQARFIRIQRAAMSRP
jgi:DtxR family Mn-dependent transcriptional regulator